MASRILFGMSREGVMPGPLGVVNENRGTPVVAIVFVTVVAIALAATGDLATLADTTVLLLLGVFIVVNLSVLVLRSDPVDHDHFRTPLVFPVLGALACAIVMTQPTGEIYARAGLLLGIGLLLWLVTYFLGSGGRGRDGDRGPDGVRGRDEAAER